MIFDLGLPLKVKQGHRHFTGVCLINGASYDRSLYEIHIASHVCVTVMGIKHNTILHFISIYLFKISCGVSPTGSEQQALSTYGITL